ncbi:MAG: Fe-S-containing hydro-lyase [Bacillota bacterium]
MIKKIYLNSPFDRNIIKSLRIGDVVYISGEIFAARDAVHKKFMQIIDNGEKLPIDINNQFIYYVGPCPAKPGQVIGSAGPTTSGRMDAYTPKLLDLGLLGMIGKGARSQKVKDSIIENEAVYFGCTGGAGALISKFIDSQEVIAFPELGAESLRRLKVNNFPVIVVVDSLGNDLYETGCQRYSDRV